MDKDKLIIDAERISKIIRNTDTDYRGNLFLLIGVNLKKQQQNCTGDLFVRIAKEYGISSKL